MEEGVLRGIPLYLDEIEHFPKWGVFPLLRNGRNVFLYQAGNYVCPMLSDGLCSIYESRPLICKSFPVCHEDKKGLTISRHRCIRLQNVREEDLDYESFGSCFDAARENERRQRELPKPTEIFSLNANSWEEL